MKTGIFLLVAMCAPVIAQQQPAAFDFKSLDKLAAKAKESTNITLDANTLKLGAGFLGNSNDKDAAEIKSLINNLKGIYIRTFEYDKPGLYDEADLEPVRAYFRGLNGSKIVDVKGKENAEIYLNSAGDSKLAGIAIVSLEPEEVAVIYINGNLDMNDLAKLSGKMGVPDMKFSNSGKPGKKSNKKDDE